MESPSFEKLNTMSPTTFVTPGYTALNCAKFSATTRYPPAGKTTLSAIL
jgi:hypothetical protein